MELAYDLLRCHGAPKAELKGSQHQHEARLRPFKIIRSRLSLSHAAKHLANRPLRTAKDLVVQGTRLQVSVVVSAAYFTVHPIKAFGKAWDIALHPLENLDALLEPLATVGETIDKDAGLPLFEPLQPIGTCGSSDLGEDKHINELIRSARLITLDNELQTVDSYGDYLRVVKELARLDDFESWKHDEELHSPSYDIQCLRQRSCELEAASGDGNPLEMVRLIRTRLNRYLGDMDNPGLYPADRSGTKATIELYTGAVCHVLKEMTKSREDKRLVGSELVEQLKLTRQAFGRTALLLSGGGTLGMTHIGLVKALFESGSLPRIVCGSSAGAIVCSVLCSRQDHEFEEVLESFCNGDLKVFVGDDEQEGLLGRITYLYKYGSLFNAENLRRVMKYHLGDLTFKEAYFKTGRILNITVSSASANESIRLLNYATTGNVLIWSAVVASCALPFGYEPGPLMCKDRTGKIERWDENILHMDGSIDGDLPFDKVSAIFNVNYFVVSQVNPHVTPYLEDYSQSWDRASTIWDDFLAVSKMELADWLHPEIVPLFATLRRKTGYIIGQRYTGDVTVLPKDSKNLVLGVLSNPSITFMHEASRSGELATWPMLNWIKSSLEIEAAIDSAVRAAEEITSFSRSASNLRRLELEQIRRLSLSGRRSGRPDSSGHQSTKSAITHGRVVVPIHAKQSRAQHRGTMSIDTHFDALGNSATKVSGDQCSLSSSCSKSRASFSLESEDEADENGVLATEHLVEDKPMVTLTAPSSPTQSFRALASLRSRSPMSIPISISRVSESSRSINTKSKQRAIGPLQPMTSLGTPQLPLNDTSPKHTSPPNEKRTLSQQTGFDRLTKKLTRKRSLSAGR